MNQLKCVPFIQIEWKMHENFSSYHHQMQLANRDFIYYLSHDLHIISLKMCLHAFSIEIAELQVLHLLK